MVNFKRKAESYDKIDIKNRIDRGEEGPSTI